MSPFRVLLACSIALTSFADAARAQDPATERPLGWHVPAGTRLHVTLTLSAKGEPSVTGKIAMLWTADQAVDGQGRMSVQVEAATLALVAYAPTQLIYKRGSKPQIVVREAKSPAFKERAEKNALETVEIYETGTLEAMIGRRSRLNWKDAQGNSKTGGWPGAHFVDAEVHVMLPDRPLAKGDSYDGEMRFMTQKPQVTIKQLTATAATLASTAEETHELSSRTTTWSCELDRKAGIPSKSTITTTWKGKDRSGSDTVVWTWKVAK